MKKYKEATKNFLGLKKEFSKVEDSRIIVIPFGLERSVSYGCGTKNGPKAIINASGDVELFDEELKKEIYRDVGIATIKEIVPKTGIKDALEQLRIVVSDAYKAKKIPIVLGGEHTLTRGSFKAAKDNFSGLTLLQFDAHADLRDSFENDKDTHSGAMRRILEMGDDFNLVQVGIRNVSNEPSEGSEFSFLEKNNDRIRTFWAKDMEKWKIDEIVNSCDKNVYLTFDVDAFDSGIMPSTGTPEPGGMSWYQILDIIRAVARKRNIVGLDFVELAPIKNLVAPNFMVAKLIYKIIGYIFTDHKSI
jgi:agmatinase